MASPIQNYGEDFEELAGDSTAEEDVFEYPLDEFEDENELPRKDVQKKHIEIIDEAKDVDFGSEASRSSFLKRNSRFFTRKDTEDYSILHSLVRKVDDGSYKRYVPFFELLLSTVPDLARQTNDEDKTALHIVVQQEKDELATYLCDHVDCDWLGHPNKTGDTCLHVALRKGLPCAELMIEKIATKDDHFGKKILSMRGEGGNTPLHIAVEYERCKGDHVKLVKRLLEVSDEAIGLDNDGGILGKSVQTKLSPLRYHQSTANSYNRTYEKKEGLGQNRKPSMPGIQKRRQSDQRLQDRAKSPLTKPAEMRQKQLPEPSKAQEIKDLLLQHCMRTRSRDDVIKIVHGPIQRRVPPDLLRKSLTVNRADRQIDFDLVSKKKISVYDLEGYAKHLKFEPVLQYVAIPKLEVDGLTPGNWKAKGRKDYLAIFDWLRDQEVKRILRVVVVDDEERPHSDEAIIEALRPFHVESWDWRKFDLCSDVISKAAGNSVREVKLYCKGNNAILRSWSADSGLARLPMLRKAHLEMHLGFETYDSTKEHVKTFKKELESTYLAQRSLQRTLDTKEQSFTKLEVTHNVCSPDDQQKKIALNGKKDKQTETSEPWIKCMTAFADFIRNYPDPLSESSEKFEPVKVALIDDGVDSTFKGLNERIARGQSYSRRGSDLCNPYYLSTCGHGTVMACLICQMCPKVKLYVAKLDEEETDSGRSITTSSAAKAINWAREMGVHIISMSWTIENPEDTDRKSLENAINEAVSRNIILFCASDDQGNTRTRDTYPAICNKQIFQIGAATTWGDKGEAVRSESVDYIFPGDKGLVTSLLGKLPDEGLRTASSLATALASGLAALILHCAALRGEKDFKALRSHKAMKKAFRAIDGNNKYLHVENVFKDYLDKGEIEGPEGDEKVLHEVVEHLLRQ